MQDRAFPLETVIAVGVSVATVIVLSLLFLVGIRQMSATRLEAGPPVTPELIEGLTQFPTATTAPPTATPDPLAEVTASDDGDAPVEHVVQAGESVASIAALYGVDFLALLEANGLTQDSLLQEGQTLVIPLPDGVFHVVAFGETLSSIAALYGVTPAVIQGANNITDADALVAGRRLLIPGVEGPAAPPTPTLPPPPDDGPALADWPRSLLAGDLSENYPLSQEHPRFTVHYQPGTLAERSLDELVFTLEEALVRVEDTLGVRMEERFNIYLAGTLFEYPNAHLRGLSGRNLDLYLLVDGSGEDADNAYLYTHELTHMVSRNTWGTPSSTMLSEGLATYVGQPVLEDGGYLPYEQVCLGGFAAQRMPNMAVIERDWQQFQGHIRDRFSYFGSACFVGWLIEQYGIETMAALYPTSDYIGLTGQSLSQLNRAWFDELEANLTEMTADANAMSDYTNEVRQAYAYVFGVYDGSPLLHRAYAAVDQARLALWRGDYEDARFWLDQVYDLTGFTP